MTTSGADGRGTSKLDLVGLSNRLGAGALLDDAVGPGAKEEDRAYAALLDWLASGARPGDPIPIRDFSRRLGMSRTPLRAAVGRLQGQGLVENRLRSGFVVALPSPDDLVDLFDVRAMIEGHALRRIELLDELPPFDALAEIAAKYDEMVSSVVADPSLYRRLNALDREFHVLIVASARSPRLRLLYEQVNLSTVLFRFATTTRITEGRLRQSATEHIAIASSMRAGRFDEAGESLLRHLGRIQRQTMHHVELARGS